MPERRIAEQSKQNRVPDLTASARVQDDIKRLAEYVEAAEKDKVRGLETDDPACANSMATNRVFAWLSGDDED